ncbi:membrane protein implicated in regulation of membrane protease activity [Rheinheimera sp. A13L]|uniref:NfeD family protein n=1 Tax=Rheinheimera sp. A13L TaxID=506534 RepID=UPI0002124B36|nr:membrane protease regulator [Rheinheimera sp. A13L]EGM76148.1 membrane protein implicated in regulation of membrane protease activity [Rheinheimera sp. A13L]
MELNLLSGLLLLALLCLALLPFAIPGVLEVLLSLAIAAFVSAALMWFGLLPDDTSLVLLSLAMLTALSAVLLWKPLRKLQKTGIRLQEDSAISDFVGTELVLTEQANKDSDSHIQFCGLEWRVRLDPEDVALLVEPGQTVVISSAMVGLLLVKSKTS